MYHYSKLDQYPLLHITVGPWTIFKDFMLEYNIVKY